MRVLVNDIHYTDQEEMFIYNKIIFNKKWEFISQAIEKLFSPNHLETSMFVYIKSRATISSRRRNSEAFAPELREELLPRYLQ